jgi:phosphocarrier protein
MTSIILLALNAAQMANRSQVRAEDQKLQPRWSAGFPAKKAEKEITILNRRGLDATFARLFVQAANRFASDIWIAKNGTEVDGKTVLGLMVLGVRRGSKLQIRVEGPDAPEAMREIQRLISWFDEGGDIMEPNGAIWRSRGSTEKLVRFP